MGSLSAAVMEKVCLFCEILLNTYLLLLLLPNPITVLPWTSVSFNILRKLIFQEGMYRAAVPESMMGQKFVGDPWNKGTSSV